MFWKGCYMEKNKYNDSVMETEYGTCFFCGRACSTARHEIFYGWANRQKAKRLGYWVNLCPTCHDDVHKYPNDGIDKYLKHKGQIKYEETHSREEFIDEWGRSYL